MVKRKVKRVRGWCPLRGWLHFYLGQECSLLLPGFPVTPPRNHNHPQLRGSTPADGGAKGLPWLGYIGPHGGLAGA